MSIAKLQTHVLAPQEPVDYSTIVSNSYPADALLAEPFIGFKVLCQDTNACAVPGSVRLKQIDQALPMLFNSGCIIRETSGAMKDGLWVITMPVPRSQVVRQLNNLMNVLGMLNHYLGIITGNIVEINVSGRCPADRTEYNMQRLMIPQPYASMCVVPDNAAYRYGYIIRINDEFMCFRTRWSLNGDNKLSNGTFEQLMLLSQLLCAMYN